MKLYIIITGNPVQGFTYQGPFTGRDVASDYGEYITDTDWWLAELLEPMPKEATP